MKYCYIFYKGTAINACSTRRMYKNQLGAQTAVHLPAPLQLQLLSDAPKLMLERHFHISLSLKGLLKH